MIVLFGAPGSGKTTQLRRLTGYDCQVEPTDDIPHLIADMYAGLPGAVYALQTEVLARRCAGYGSATRTMVGDGHIETDYLMYVGAHIASGALAGDELVQYERQLADARAIAPRIELLIFLKVSGDVAANRVARRMSAGEKGVDRACIAELAARAERVVAALTVPVVTVDADADEATVAAAVALKMDSLQ